MELARAGVDVRIVSPHPRAALINTFAVWIEHLHGLDVPLLRRWDAVDVRCRKEHRVERAYGLVDSNALVARTDQHIADRWIQGSVRHVEGTTDGRMVSLLDGRTIIARLVIDASGSARVTSSAPRIPSTSAHQVALGDFVSTREHPSRPMLMDFSGGEASEAAPSFGYILPTSDDTLLIEETWLAIRPARPVTDLEAALAVRRARWPTGPVTGTEQVSIDLEVPLASASSLCVMLGAAGGQVHPATGYSFAAGVSSAVRLAEFCASNRSKLGRDGFVWEANKHVVPEAQRRARALFAYGLDAMLRMDRDTIAGFFEGFFHLSPEDQSIYLNGLSGVIGVRSVMLKLFPTLPRAVQWTLVAGSPLRLGRAFF
jgi:lycopene beta-cyclase